MPVTVAQLEDEVAWRCGQLLRDVGRYLDGAAGTTRAILAGLRRGAQAVGLAPATPLAVADADLVHLGSAAIDRVLDVAELSALRVVLLRWPQAMETVGIEPVQKAEDTRGGTLWAQQQAVKDRVAELERIVAEPYLVPGSGTVVVRERSHRWHEPYWDICPWGEIS